MRCADHGEGEFLILPHPVVLKYIQGKAGDYDRWLGGMRKPRNVIGTIRAFDTV